jgi:hypothetical protein
VTSVDPVRLTISSGCLTKLVRQPTQGNAIRPLPPGAPEIELPIGAGVVIPSDTRKKAWSVGVWRQRSHEKGVAPTVRRFLSLVAPGRDEREVPYPPFRHFSLVSGRVNPRTQRSHSSERFRCQTVAARLRLDSNPSCPQSSPSVTVYRDLVVSFASDVTVPQPRLP